jgi:hypothetical protein
MTKKPPPKLKLVKSTPSNVIAPPHRLSGHGTDLWIVIQTEYAITDGSGVEVLMQACASLDRAEEMAAAIDRDGPIVLVKGVPREHPLLRSRLTSSQYSFASRRTNRIAAIIIQMIAMTAPTTRAIQKALPKNAIAAPRPNNSTNRMPASRMTIKRLWFLSISTRRV